MFGFHLWAVTPYTVVETEHLLYSLESLVAEAGGSLGLFLGFSFLTLWDRTEKGLRLLGKLLRERRGSGD